MQADTTSRPGVGFRDAYDAAARAVSLDGAACVAGGCLAYLLRPSQIDGLPAWAPFTLTFLVSLVAIVGSMLLRTGPRRDSRSKTRRWLASFGLLGFVATIAVGSAGIWLGLGMLIAGIAALPVGRAIPR